MLENLKLLGATLARMEYSSTRQKLIANNIAHADTPNYKGKDLKAFSLSEPPLQQNSTRLEHFDASEKSLYGYILETTKNDVYDQTLNKNKISIEEEMVKASETESGHRLATTVWQRSLALLKMSLGSHS
jgi:flagellar basal-body rod protein FlgB